VKAAGLLLEKEIKYFTKLLAEPDSPFFAVLGGAKVSDKIGVIKNLFGLVNAILIGGGMAYTFLAAMGVNVADSMVEKDKLDLANEILAEAKAKKVEILLPTDHVVAKEIKADAKTRIVDNNGFEPGDKGLDIGPETAARYAAKIKQASTVVLNGPMGVFEMEPFYKGTETVIRAIAEADALSVVGGGDSAAAVNKVGVEDKISHISTGGGASLEMLEGKKLPGIAALEE